MIPTKFYRIDNQTLLHATMFKNDLGYVGPRRNRSILAKLAPWAVAVVVGIGYSVFKIAGA